MLFSAVVRDKETKRIVILKDKEYPTKSKFIEDIKNNGYTVNPMKVKKSEVFEYIMSHTNCNPWDWKENN